MMKVKFVRFIIYHFFRVAPSGDATMSQKANHFVRSVVRKISFLLGAFFVHILEMYQMARIGNKVFIDTIYVA